MNTICIMCPMGCPLTIEEVNGEVVAVLDIDSERYSTFDDTDRLWLEKVAVALANGWR